MNCDLMWQRVLDVFSRWCLVCTVATGMSSGGLQAAEFNYPLAVRASSDTGGPVYVADRYLPGIWKIVDGKPEVYFQASRKFRTPLNAVRCVTLDKNGLVLAGDSSTRDVYRFDRNAKPTPLTDGGIGIPMGIAVDPQGDLFVTDLELHRIRKVPAAGGKPTEFAVVPAPRGLTIDAAGRLWVVSHGENQLLRISPQGEIEPIVKGRPFQFPHEVILDAKNVAYVTDGYAKAVWKVDESGQPKQFVSGEPFRNPVGLAWQGKNLLVADPHAKAIFKVDPQGNVTPLAKAAD